MESENILAIWRRCSLSDRNAQSQLYQLYAEKMYSICLRYTNSIEEAQDILQNGFIKVFTKSNLYEGKGSLEGWIKRIIINTAIEHFRRQKLKFQTTDQINENQIEESSFSASSILEYKDLMHLVQNLPLGYRTVFNLYAIEGYNHKEISEMLQISEGNSKSQLSRARSWLKDRLIKMEEFGT